MPRLLIFVRNTFVVFGAQLLLMLLLAFVMRRRMDYYLNSGAEVPGYERFLMAVTFFWSRLWPFIVIIFFWIGFGTAGAIELFGSSRKERA
jgi:type II secretory pathway component PulF